MISGHCRSNDDDLAKEKWPTIFVAVPRKGEVVRSTSSLRIGHVCRVTHCTRPNQTFDPLAGNEIPFVEIELTPRSVKASE